MHQTVLVLPGHTPGLSPLILPHVLTYQFSNVGSKLGWLHILAPTRLYLEGDDGTCGAEQRECCNLIGGDRGLDMKPALALLQKTNMFLALASL